MSVIDGAGGSMVDNFGKTTAKWEVLPRPTVTTALKFRLAHRESYTLIGVAIQSTRRIGLAAELIWRTAGINPAIRPAYLSTRKTLSDTNNYHLISSGLPHILGL